MLDLPKISVITVSLNAEATIEQAILSVIHQNYPNLEFIIIDGDSSDNTTDIINNYKEHISYFQSQKDKGASQALNMGISKSTGDIIAFLFADDWLEPGTLQKIAQAYQNEPSADIISCQSRIVKKNKRVGNYTITHAYTRNKDLVITLDNMLFNQPLIANRFFSKRFLDKIGSFIENYANHTDFYSNDRELLIRAALCNPNNIIINHIGYNYLQHDNSRTLNQNTATRIRICEEHIFIANYCLSNNQLSKAQKEQVFLWKSIKYTQIFLQSILLKRYKKSLDALIHIKPKHYFPTVHYFLKKIASGVTKKWGEPNIVAF